MSVITISKSYDELHGSPTKRGALPIIVLGGNKCAKTSKTGGSQEVQELRDRLRASGLMLRETAGLADDGHGQRHCGRGAGLARVGEEVEDGDHEPRAGAPALPVPAAARATPGSRSRPR